MILIPSFVPCRCPFKADLLGRCQWRWSFLQNTGLRISKKPIQRDLAILLALCAYDGIFPSQRHFSLDMSFSAYILFPLELEFLCRLDWWILHAFVTVLRCLSLQRFIKASASFCVVLPVGCSLASGVLFFCVLNIKSLSAPRHKETNVSLAEKKPLESLLKVILP